MTKNELVEKFKREMPEFEGIEEEKEIKTALYIYIELGKMKSFDERYFFGNSKLVRQSEKEAVEDSRNVDKIAGKRKILCITMTHLYKAILAEFGIESEIIRLEVDEVVKLLDMSEQGNGLTTMQKGFHKHTKERDFALLSLFLGTGIRISECVGLNVDDVDFDNNAFTITRKGGSRVILYFSDEVKDALLKWIEVRNNIKDLPNTEKALFVSLQNKRMLQFPKILGVMQQQKLNLEQNKITAKNCNFSLKFVRTNV